VIVLRKTLQRYGFTKDPFSKDVPAEELFDYPGTEAALGRLVAAVEGRTSAALTGEPGTGKTFVFRALEAKLPQGRYRLTYLHNATLNHRDFYRQLAAALGIEPKATAEAVFRNVSAQVEETATAQKVHPVLVLDEAHLLPQAVLGHLHILLNFHRDSKPLLSIVLIGLSELRDKLTRNVLASLAARIPIRVHMGSLEGENVAAYLRHRLRTAGCAQEVFSEDGVLLIAEATGGVMRKINILAGASLDVTGESKAKLVDAGVVQEAVKRCAEAIA
jgi:type II secretory pathway predicted ATPase ExeA